MLAAKAAGRNILIVLLVRNWQLLNKSNNKKPTTFLIEFSYFILD